jgi:hypothetical protein
MRISERYVPVTLIESKDYGSAGIQSDAVHMGKLHSLTVLLTFGALTGNSILTIFASAARDLVTTAIAFNYRLGAAVYKAALADQLGDVIAVSATGLTLTAATFQHKQVAIEFDSDAFTDGKPWLTLNIDSTATVMNVAAVAIGTPRYPGHLIPSVL